VHFTVCVRFTIVRKESRPPLLFSASDLSLSLSFSLHLYLSATLSQPVRLDIEYDAIVPDVRLVDDEIDFGEVTTGMQDEKEHFRWKITSVFFFQILYSSMDFAYNLWSLYSSYA
jgi:hypothetical protein